MKEKIVDCSISNEHTVLLNDPVNLKIVNLREGKSATITVAQSYSDKSKDTQMFKDLKFLMKENEKSRKFIWFLSIIIVILLISLWT